MSFLDAIKTRMMPMLNTTEGMCEVPKRLLPPKATLKVITLASLFFTANCADSGLSDQLLALQIFGPPVVLVGTFCCVLLCGLYCCVRDAASRRATQENAYMENV